MTTSCWLAPFTLCAGVGRVVAVDMLVVAPEAVVLVFCRASEEVAGETCDGL